MSQPSSVANRRESRRLRSQARLLLKLSDGRQSKGHMMDVSASGAQVALLPKAHMPKQGQRLVLELVGDDAKDAPPQMGEVAWTAAPHRHVLGVRFLTEEVSVPAVDQSLDVERLKVDPKIALKFPTHQARRWQVLPFAELKGCVMVAVATDPLLPQTRAALDRIYRCEIQLHPSEPEALRRAIERAYAGGDVLTAETGLNAAADEAASEPDAIALYNQILAEAIMYGASDIHIDSFEDRVRLRVRVDGRIEHLRDMEVASGLALISRMKVMAGLDISERRAAQDGRLQHETGSGIRVDVRVATLPTKNGERLTLRLLAQESSEITLGTLGMSPSQLEEFGRAIRQPYGLILLTGPTGSGKSTTLYAAIRQLISESDLNVITIEDPIEYQIPEVTQVEVDHAEKVTFAKALRSTLRHDPDVVMVGEIRDSETASIAVKAALTGHLVFSTLHTNDAAGALTRLTDMGVPEYLVAATLRLVVAQRLVRQLCSSCATTHACEASDAATLGRPDLAGRSVRQPTGCVYCGQRGYSGRLALFEMLTVDRELSQLIVGKATEGQIKAHLQTREVPTLADDAAEKLLDGRTSIAEVLRNVVSFAGLTDSMKTAPNLSGDDLDA